MLLFLSPRYSSLGTREDTKSYAFLFFLKSHYGTETETFISLKQLDLLKKYQIYNLLKLRWKPFLKSITLTNTSG